MKTFLAPIDFSAVTEDVINTAITFARAFSGRVVLINVVQPPVVTSEFGLPVEVIQEAVTSAKNVAQTKLDDCLATLNAAQIPSEGRVTHGPSVTLILEEAQSCGADYIIMGSHGHGRLYDLLVGSTASGVVKKAKCGVVIVPPRDKSA